MYLTDRDGHTIHRPNFWVDIKLLNSLGSYKSSISSSSVAELPIKPNTT